MSYLLGLATGVAIGVYIGLRLVWAEEPAWDEIDRIAPPYADDWATDPHLTTLTEGGNPR